MNTHIGDKIFQNTPRRVAKFRKNRPRDVEKSVLGKKIKHGQNITCSLPLSLQRYAGVCNKRHCLRMRIPCGDKFPQVIGKKPKERNCIQQQTGSH